MFLNFTSGDDYYSRKETNQSALKKILIHPQEYIKEISREDSLSDKYEKGYLNMGSMVDCLIFEKHLFDKMYASDSNSPPPQELSFINYIIEHNKEEVVSEDIYEAAFKYVAPKKKKIESFKEAINEVYYDYYQKRLNNPDILFLSEKEIEKAKQIAHSIDTHELSSIYFKANNENEEVIYQPSIFFEYMGLNMRSRLDCIKINHKEKIIIVSDLKTTSDRPSSFKYNFEKYNYGFQAAFYILAVRYFIKYLRPELENYTIKPFAFVVQSTVYTTLPLAYEVSQKTMYEKIMEVDIAVNLLKFHQQYGFEYTREEKEAGYILTI